MAHVQRLWQRFIRKLFRPLLLALLASLLPIASASARVVDLLLVLAVDISRSVDSEEFQLQRQGYAQALTHPEILAAIQSGSIGAIAISYIEWSGADQQVLILDWTVIENEESARMAAGRILEADRSFYGYTSISEAIKKGTSLIASAPHEGMRQVIDVSGDGSNNSGAPVTVARDEAVKAGIVINGLPILNDRPNPFGQLDQKLDEYYRNFVIGGPGAFMEPARDFQAFAAAVRAKLVKEIAGMPDPRPNDGRLAELTPDLQDRQR
ncbi:DUF1194 domain-containing protein [Lacibacterium aquatile]|uniref:DUF1194 domain-containing protein n=1 Tax=Lacibacterium aquatile TaxID=1168082 RepID=A0ABW5DWE6_9PROT